MKFLPFILLTILSVNLLASNGWQWQNPWPTGNHLYDVWMFNDSTIIADGTGGSFLLTDNGGESWTELQMTDYIAIVGLMFINSQTGFAIGINQNQNSLLITNDSGQNWTDYPIPTYRELNDLFFLDQNLGWVVGDDGDIYKTTDGGLNWQDQSLNVGLHLYSVFFIDSLNGWAVGEVGLIAHTTDGGDYWSYSYLPNKKDLTSIVFTNSVSGWITGANNNWQGIILASTDGGISWNMQFSTSNVDPMLYIFALNNQQLWACSNYGKILKSFDGGLHWTVTQTSPRFSLDSIFFIDDLVGYVVGHVGRIFRTSDGGNNWEQVGRAATYADLKAIEMVNENIGWSVGVSDWAIGINGTILKTDNGGQTWIAQNFSKSKLFGLINSTINFNSLAVSSETNIWAAGNKQISTDRTQGLITYSHDDGQTWQSIIFSDNDGFLDIDFVTNSTGWALAWKNYNRILYKTTDGGQNWTVVWNDTSNSMANKIEFVSENTGWISSLTNDTLWKTVNGGAEWTIQLIGFPYGVGDIYFVNEQKGWVVGGYEIFGPYPLGGEGYILKTNDGGSYWFQQKRIMKDMFIGIDFYDNLHGTAVGYNGTIYRTEDGGTNWNAQKSTMLWTINDVDFVNSQKGWMCGFYGAILYTETGGISNIHTPLVDYNTPDNITLFQNYPNPFNSTTTIKFTTAQSGEVKIEIFNILGERVTTLLSKHLLPGTYNVKWNGLDKTGETVPSGVYLLRVKNITSSGVFSKTNKMIFLK